MVPEEIEVPGLAEASRRYVELIGTVGRDHPEAMAINQAIHTAMARVGWQAEELKRTRVLEGSETFVCYLDVDGFRSKVTTNAEALYDEYKTLHTFMLASFFMASTQTRGDVIEIHHSDKLLWPYAFSDSWFLATVDASEESLRQLASAAAGIFMRFFEIGLPARGGIARGRTWWNPGEQIVLGPSIVDAYALGDLLDVFGIAVEPVVANAAADGIVTAPLRVRLRSGAEESLSFARLYAQETNSRWNTTHYRAKFASMADSYERSPGAISRVVERYQRSHAVVAAMLEGLLDEPGYGTAEP